MPALTSSFEQRERRFALALLAPALLLLLLITTAPLVYLLWASVQRLDMSMPWMSGFAGLGGFCLGRCAGAGRCKPRGYGRPG